MLQVKFFTFSPIHENTYLLFNEHNKAIIIDPGCYFSAEQETLKKFMIEKGLEPVQLLNTHCHLDHVFGNKWVFDTWGLELYIHSGEAEMLKLSPLSGEKWGLPFESYSGPLHFLAEGDSVLLDDEELKIIFTPGHSPASICFYSEKHKILIGGDVLFRESIGRTDLPGGNHAQLLKSIREQLFVLSDDVIVYPGHGMPTTLGYEKQHNPFLQ